jgi:integrase
MRGSVGKREGPQGTSWWWKLGGTQRRGYPTRKAAQAALDEAKVAVRRGDWIEPSKEPLAAYLTRWLESTAHRRKAQSTASYADGIAVVSARLGAIPLGKLSTLDVQELVNALSARYAPRTVRERHMVLKQALQQAVRWRLVAFNAADGVDLPRVPKVDRGVWNKEEVNRFLEEAERECDQRPGESFPRLTGALDFHPPLATNAQSIKELALWRLLLDSGMRIGEAVALRWTDIEWGICGASASSATGDQPRRDSNPHLPHQGQFTTGRVRVERTQSSVGGRLVVGTPKTAASRRTIPLEPETIAALRRHELAQKAERLRLGLRDKEGWVFTVRGGGMASASATRRWLDRAIARSGVPPITPHGLRRTMTVLWRDSGVDVEVVSKRLGHSSVVMTLDVYSSVSRERADDAVARVREYKEG